MPWESNSVDELKLELVERMDSNEESVTDICADLGISRPIAYKWYQRFQHEGLDGLKDRSRARRTQSNRTDTQTETKVLEVKAQYPRWGGKKIYAYLERTEPDHDWPSYATMCNILKRNGLVNKRKKRKRVPARTQPLAHCVEPNDMWCADFKGKFITRDGVVCEPFTVSDGCSRFLLHCSRLPSTKGVDVWNSFVRLFDEYGLPTYLRTDNGPPFASNGAGRLSALSVNLIKAGVTPEWIDPGCPYQNGRHERMHSTLKSEAIFPNRLTLEEQQMEFTEFLHYYNYVRPHEGIGQQVPHDVYVKSDRKWNGKLLSPEYSKDYIVKTVRKHGQVGWRGYSPFIGKALAGEPIGLIPIENDGLWHVYYGPVLLGVMSHDGEFTISQRPSRPKRKYKARCY